MESLTDLEAAALGCIHRNQPCTAHFIRTRFRESPSARFSDSAGSVYPMVTRLERRELISGKARKDGRRQVHDYSTTAKGRAALRVWLGPPLDDGLSITIDPLRTRALHLGLLSPAKRAEWLDEAERVLARQLESIERFARAHDEEDDPFFALAHENARLTIHAREEWIRAARSRLGAAGLLRG